MTGMFDRILLPTDGSESMDQVVETALDVATTRDARVDLLYVVDDRAFLTLDEERIEGVVDDLESKGQTALSEAATRFEDAGLDVETAMRRGNPADEILAHAADVGDDLIVMGSHGADYERNLLGSVSQKVVTMASVPVLTVNVGSRPE